MTFLLLPDLDLSLGHARRRNKRVLRSTGADENRFERENRAFYSRVLDKYREIAARDRLRVVVIDGGSIHLHQKIVRAAEQRLEFHSVQRLLNGLIVFSTWASEQFLGNPATVRRLREAIAGGRLPSALILAGPRGAGKYTLAIMLAQTLACLKHPVSDGLPDFCGDCSNCVRIALSFLERSCERGDCSPRRSPRGGQEGYQDPDPDSS